MNKIIYKNTINTGISTVIDQSLRKLLRNIRYCAQSVLSFKYCHLFFLLTQNAQSTGNKVLWILLLTS